MRTINNVKFVYLYRDASNYKAWGEVIFDNTDNLVLYEIEERLRRSLDGGEYFLANQVCIPEVFLFQKDIFTEDDHYYHEFHCVEYTSNQCTDFYGRSIKTFVEQVEHVGWYDWPLDMRVKGPIP